MDFLVFDKYAYYIWTSYLLTFIVIAFFFISAKSNRKRIITQLRIKYLRDKQVGKND
ncbi:hypothetical protein SPONN_262 [uncultured Candidatus Thioglobus sp.]|nr:hypothetical protein SPONL_1712 [uncultured Candidatus Thioglobus sp.]SMM99097.1 hypothetical protein SPONN_262 [uncultured Candidatus Thioglobus sp.]SMN02160.1 hypothetical protein SPONL_593 [uncultured Candidatus Thioglobus sp.]